MIKTQSYLPDKKTMEWYITMNDNFVQSKIKELEHYSNCNDHGAYRKVFAQLMAVAEPTVMTTSVAEVNPSGRTISVHITNFNGSLSGDGFVTRRKELYKFDPKLPIGELEEYEYAQHYGNQEPISMKSENKQLPSIRK